MSYGTKIKLESAYMYFEGGNGQTSQTSQNQ